jgi:hypothetical protein
VFPVRYELNLYILFRISSDFGRLMSISLQALPSSVLTTDEFGSGYNF